MHNHRAQEKASLLMITFINCLFKLLLDFFVVGKDFSIFFSTLRVPFQNHFTPASSSTYMMRLQVPVSAFTSRIIYSKIHTQDTVITHVLNRKNVNTLSSLINSAGHQHMIGPTCNFLANGSNKSRLTIISLYPARAYYTFSSTGKIYKQPASSVDTGTLTSTGI
mmetsp:Transcript_21991/g.57391  ORF Transcript_21991/g.57391 Transcript_21991/m.57391 type:complete len:165 (+) Transcript_21991:314-808(+)